MIQPTLDSIPNHAGNRTYAVTLEYAGFRCQQEVNLQLTNFAHLKIEYAPADRLYDFGSLIMYLKSFEPESLSLETAANRIVDDLFTHLKPVWARVTLSQQREHGVKIEIVAAQGRYPGGCE
jgi:7-cyano-7-deazaguanine reductase